MPAFVAWISPPLLFSKFLKLELAIGTERNLLTIVVISTFSLADALRTSIFAPQFSLLAF
jgi:hypothetical protein